MSLARRLRLLRRRTARWFQPPVRAVTPEALDGVRESPASAVLPRGLKPPHQLH